MAMPRETAQQDSVCISHLSALCVSTCCPITTKEEINPISLQEEGPVGRHLPLHRSHPEALTFCLPLVQSTSSFQPQHTSHHSFSSCRALKPNPSSSRLDPDAFFFSELTPPLCPPASTLIPAYFHRGKNQCIKA